MIYNIFIIYLLWQPLVKITNRLLSKLKGKVSCRDHKRIDKKFLVFLYYLYKRVMVYTNDK